VRCPYCDSLDNKVVDSRATEGGRAIRRRRHCVQCEKRFTTYEHVEQITRLTVVKKSGDRVPYDKLKLAAGLQKACYKRPVRAEDIDRIVDEVEEELFRRGDREVDSIEIGNLAAARLKTLDHVAYVRFASVYKQFRDLDDFLEEVRELMAAGPPAGPDQGSLF